MHDIKIAKELVDEAKKHGTVTSITVEVGELAPLTVEELKSALGLLVDWDLNVSEREARVECGCGFSGRPKIIMRQHEAVLYECPSCGSVPEMKEGSEIILKKVEVD